MKRPAPTPQASINITPYIDILLVLLIIFMVVQSTPQFAHQARVPEGEAAPTSLAPVLVSVDGDLTIRLNGQAVLPAQFGERILETLGGRPDKTIVFRAEPEIPFGVVARLIDLARGAGAQTIGIS